MNKILVLSSLSALVALSASPLLGQSEMSAIRLAEGENNSGSARYQALSGAMGAVGVDFSSASQNPAGLALFRSRGKVSVTGGGYWNKEKNTWYNDQSSLNKSGFRFDELSYMTSWLAGSTSMTIGFGVRNGGRFDRRLDAHANKGLGWDHGISLADYTADIMNRAPYGSNAYTTAGAYRTGAPWLGTLAWRAGWVGNANDGTAKGRFHSAYVYDANGNRLLTGSAEAPQSVGLVLRESGHITDYDLAFGVNFSPVFSLGVMGTISYLDYTLSSYYSEGFRTAGGGQQVDGLSLDNWVNTRGTGFKLGLGVLFEPLEGLRLGAAVWTPTYYSLKTDFNAGATGYSQLTTGNGVASESTPYSGANSFEARHPWRFTLSGAYIFGKRGLISVDYEYRNLGDTRLDEGGTEEDYGYRGNPYDGENDAIDSDFGARHTLRIGGELNLAPQVALRAGFRRSFAPSYNATMKHEYPEVEALVSGTQVHYSLPDTYSTYSLGLGYRITPKWTLDFAYSYGVNKSRIYAFPSINLGTQNSPEWDGLAPIREERQQHRAVMTASFRF